jgi:hypothetical protein
MAFYCTYRTVPYRTVGSLPYLLYIHTTPITLTVRETLVRVECYGTCHLGSLFQNNAYEKRSLVQNATCHLVVIFSKITPTVDDSTGTVR